MKELRFRTRTMLAVLGCVALVAAACGGSEGATQPDDAAAEDDDGGAAVASEGQGCEGDETLEFWYLTSGPEGLAQMEELSRRFEADNPDVEIDINAVPFEDMRRNMPLALDGGSGPDIATVSSGPQASDLYAWGGHLVDLTEVAEERGWTEIHPIDIIEYNNAGTPGQIFGVPIFVQTVGVFYNVDLFEDLDLEPATTWDEWHELVADLQAADQVPLSTGGLDGWPLNHVWEQILHLTTPIEVIERLEQLDPDVGYDHEGFVRANAELLEWFESDYFNDGMLATSYSDANTLFITGEVAMNIGGTWAAPEFQSEPEFEVRFFPLPQVDPSLPWHMGGFAPSNNFVIPVYGDHIPCAIEFMDFMLGEQAATYLWEQGQLVTYRFADTPAAETNLQSDVYEAMQNAGPGYYMGVVNGEIQTATWDAVQRLVLGEVDAQGAADHIQQVYERVVAAAEAGELEDG